MPHCCCAGQCNSSATRKDLSWHQLPFENKNILKVWVTKMRRDPRYFNVNKHTKICSEHFKNDDFIEPDAKVKRLKMNAVPSIFEWSPEKLEKPRRVLKRLFSHNVEQRR